MSGGGGGGGCNILEIFCKRKSKEIVSFDIEDKAATTEATGGGGLCSHSHAPLGEDPSFREVTGAPCHNCSLISMSEAVPNAFGRCHQG